jgi:hypothetical protein
VAVEAANVSIRDTHGATDAAAQRFFPREQFALCAMSNNSLLFDFISIPGIGLVPKPKLRDAELSESV